MNSGNQRPVKDDDESESEWEYEYSNTETEDFYVLVDFPQAKLAMSGQGEEIVPSMFNSADLSKGIKRRKVPKSRSKRKRRRKRDPETGELIPLTSSEDEEAGGKAGDEEEENDEEVENDNAAVNEEEEGEGEDEEEGKPQQNAAKSQPQDDLELSGASTLQLLNMGSKKPMLMLDSGRVYLLEWATSLGTDMYFAKRDADTQPAKNALKSFENWDLIAVSAARLVATQAALRYKDNPTVPTESATSRDTVGNTVPPIEGSRPGFLRRLVEAQIRKGEINRDEVIFTADEAPFAQESASASSNDPLANRLAYNMIMGEVVERIDGTPMVMSTRRPAEPRRGMLPRELSDKLAAPEDDIIIVRRGSRRGDE